MRGRKPLPLEVHTLRGNPGRRPLPKAVPAPAGWPQCPEHFDEAHRAEWNTACELLSSMGILSRADRVALELFCETYIAYRTACAEVLKAGAVICLDSRKRKYVINPQWRIRNAAWEQLYKILGEFGFSPSARARLAAGKSPDAVADDPLAEMLRARAGNN